MDNSTMQRVALLPSAAVMSSAAPAAVLLVCLAVVWVAGSRRSGKKMPPMPKGLPLVGNLFQVTLIKIINIKDVHLFLLGHWGLEMSQHFFLDISKYNRSTQCPDCSPTYSVYIVSCLAKSAEHVWTMNVYINVVLICKCSYYFHQK